MFLVPSATSMRVFRTLLVLTTVIAVSGQPVWASAAMCVAAVPPSPSDTGAASADDAPVRPCCRRPQPDHTPPACCCSGDVEPQDCPCLAKRERPQAPAQETTTTSSPEWLTALLATSELVERDDAAPLSGADRVHFATPHKQSLQARFCVWLT
jgi:hypothetical protein